MGKRSVLKTAGLALLVVSGSIALDLPAIARKPAQSAETDVRAAVETFEKFRGCKERLGAKNPTEEARRSFLECTSKHLSRGISESLRRQLSGWLYFPFEIRDTAACGDEALQSAPAADLERSDAVICFAIAAHSGVRRGYAFFTREDETLRLNSVKY